LIAVGCASLLTWIGAYPAWFTHADALKAKRLTTPEKREELLRTFLLGEFDALREDLLGDGSNLCVLETKMAGQLEQARVILSQLERRLAARAVGEHRERMQEEIGEMKSFIERFEQGLAKLQRHIAKVRGYLDECRSELEGVASDLSILEESRSLRREAEQTMDRVDETMLVSLVELQGRLMALQEKTRDLFGEAAETRFSSSPRLAQDLAVFEELVERALEESTLTKASVLAKR
jgi:chromosome segregation ATPase